MLVQIRTPPPPPRGGGAPINSPPFQALLTFFLGPIALDRSAAPRIGSKRRSASKWAPGYTVAGRGHLSWCLFCIAGYWAPNASAIYTCVACPSGGECEGQFALPHAQQGYWSPARNTSRKTGDTAVYTSSFLICAAFVGGLNCPGGCGASDDIHCPVGGSSARCAEGYAGTAW